MDELIQQIAQALGLNAADLTSSISVDGKLPEGKALYVALAGEITTTMTQVKTEQHGRGLSTSQKKAIAAIRKHLPDLEIDEKTAKIDTLIDAAIEAAVASAKGSTEPGKVDLKSPEVKAAIDAAVKKEREINTTLSTEFESYKAKVEGEKVETVLSTYLETLLTDKKMNFGPESKLKAERLEVVKMLVKQEGNLALDSKGKPILVDAEGNEVRDAAGRPVTIEKVALAKGETFGYHQQDPGKGGSGAARSGAAGSGGEGVKYTFTDAKDYETKLRSEPEAKNRAKMMEDYAASLDDEPTGS
jgi:hypothetical protein